MNAVGAVKRCEAEIGNDKPLRRNGAAAFLVIAVGCGQFVGRLCDHQIDAGLELAERVEYRKSGRHVLVEFARCGKRAGPDLPAVVLDKLFDPVGG